MAILIKGGHVIDPGRVNGVADVLIDQGKIAAVGTNLPAPAGCTTIDAKGQLVIVEIKVSKADLLGDGKWPDYLDHCDRFYWGLATHLDRACMETEAFRPDQCGLIVADGYDAEVLRPAATVPLAAARRRVEVERLARASLRRHQALADPRPGGWNV